MQVAKVYCNNCEKTKSDAYSEWFHYNNQWGYFGVSDTRTDVIDLCNECYTDIINKFKIHPMVD